MPGTQPIIVCGLGPIGESVACLAAAEGPGVAALVDRDPARLAAAAVATGPGPAVFPDLGAALAEHRGHPVVLCTRSGFREIVPDLHAAAAAGSSVVTSCEEAVWPWSRAPDEARALDALARAHGVVLIGGGINPGFLMDVLPAIVSAPFPRPDLLRVVRRVDVGRRREPLRRKVGLGLTVEAFERARAQGRMGHRGLTESLDLLGALLGVAWERREVTLEPVVAETAHRIGERDLAPGTVLGMRNVGRAWRHGTLRVELDLIMAHGLDDVVDRVELIGTAPPLPVHVEMPGGVDGDVGTTRVLVNLLPYLRTLEPGFRTVADVPGGVRGRFALGAFAPSP